MRVGKVLMIKGSHIFHRNSKNLPLPSNSNTFSGDLTYYDPGLGACGENSTQDDKIVSLSYLLFDQAGMILVCRAKSRLTLTFVQAQLPATAATRTTTPCVEG